MSLLGSIIISLVAPSHDEACYDDGHPGAIAKLKEIIISIFLAEGDQRALRRWLLQLGDLQKDDNGVDDLDGATTAYLPSKLKVSARSLH